MRGAVGGMQDVIIRSNKALRETSLKIFDRTFTITTVLRLLAVVVAFIGVLSALMALALERRREFGVLRATGMTPKQVGGYVTLQTSLMGLIAGVLSLPLGYVLAYVLVYVINKRSFGWTLQLSVAPEVLGQALLLAVAAAFLAGLYPAWQMARSSPALALRDE
jgi:putative ABC transport system permease protein